MERHLVTEAFLEQGMEGVDYCLYDESKEGYAGLTSLNNGDHLIIPKHFKGYIKKVGNAYGLSWYQEGWDKQKWQSLFWKKHSVIYRAKQEKPSIYTQDFTFIN